MKPAPPICQCFHATRLPCTPRKRTAPLARSFAAIDAPGTGFFCIQPFEHSIIVLEEFCQTAHKITLLTAFRYFDNNLRPLFSEPYDAHARAREKLKIAAFLT
jgi:hypothetical protein